MRAGFRRGLEIGHKKPPEDLFNAKPGQTSCDVVPLAERMRPQTIREFVGQRHLVGEGKVLKCTAELGHAYSMILWGPPGTGKTTLARILAQASNCHFISFSAVLSGVKEIRGVVEEAIRQKKYYGRGTVLFVDEIHRFNKAQQDAFLPHVEKGTVILIGATTENPSFEVISPLLSRAKVFTLEPLKRGEILDIIKRALSDPQKGLGELNLDTTDEILDRIAAFANGDARIALNALELAAAIASPDRENRRPLTDEIVRETLGKRSLIYDKNGEEHHNLISAFHKSLRGGDPDAALYWLGRMLEAGEDPLYIARDPQALLIATAATEAFRFIGSPEGELALAQTAIYLASAPKSNAVYQAYGEMLQDVRGKDALPVPFHLRNAPTGLMKKLGYGKGYKYPHDYPKHFVDDNYFPENLKRRVYYRPGDIGFEEEIKLRLARWWKEKKNRHSE
jgi:putative ATPase